MFTRRFIFSWQHFEQAQADKTSALLKAEADAETITLIGQAKKNALDSEGEAYARNRDLVELRQIELKALALAKVGNVSITSPEFANLFYPRNLPFTLFSNTTPTIANQAAIENEIEPRNIGPNQH